MSRKQRDQQHPAEHPTADDANPFTDSSFLVTPTIGQSALPPYAPASANTTDATPRTSPNQTPHSAIPDETPLGADASPWATLTLPPLADPTDPTTSAAGAPSAAPGAMPGVGASPRQPGVSRSARPTGAPQRDGQRDPHGEAQRALVRAWRADERQLATRGAGDGASATPATIIRGAHKTPRTFGPVVPRRRGPSSFLAQFIVTMVTTVILFSVVTLATPLGQNAVLGNPFQAYANAIPIIPTATPTSPPTATPLPVGYNPGATVIMNMIRSVFGPYAQGALNVSRCESGYDPNAWNPYPIGNSHASGVFQILYPSTWDTTSYSGYSPYDANANIHAAYEIFSRDGYSWREWQCQP